MTLKGLDRIIRTLDEIARPIMDRIDRRRAIVELARMQDWRLADLGIERGRIPEIVDGLINRRAGSRGSARTALPPATSTGGLPGGPVSEVPA